ncbi:hypothetical protein IJJ27_00535 [bacterium]|nr:hypothetical protein [bacterium]
MSEFDTVCLADPRDYRTYRVRKFGNGQCWMVDNLKFGGNYGETDGCAANNGEGNYTYAWCGGSGTSACTRGGATSVTKAQEQFSTGYYGHCRAANAAYNNYLYDWAAAMQSTQAYYSSSFNSYLTPWQGICPTGWHLPSGGEGGEWTDLADYYGNNSAVFWLNTAQGNFTLAEYAMGSSGSLTAA